MQKNVILNSKIKDKKKFKIKSIDASHPLQGLEWYRPNHWLASTNWDAANVTSSCKSDKWDATTAETAGCVQITIHGLMEIRKVRAKLKAKNIKLTYKEAMTIGINNLTVSKNCVQLDVTS